ncbi:MAG: aminodeoxychorismate lyase [Oceanospirillaceae bacterium]|nr:aminodeoxychorismate lyase [Thalassolituus sp.]MAX99001.1 aminodeoxychorismate lyase [Oceanospirillaceae bacterium]MBS53276.1 aminodeoxychorismate lyase [Oceanospirillaceae bacterium]|tara:strand:- start:2393 stop:3211 length:819 start_codon:yes stop_codon:yes gene_type:complete
MADALFSLSDNGHWFASDSLSAVDRGLQYGDGLFETLRRASDGSVPLKAFHLQRLQRGFKALGFDASLVSRLDRALDSLPAGFSAAKLVVTRGDSARGYLPPQNPQYHIQCQCFSAPAFACERLPQGLTTDISDISLAQQPLLAGFKHLNRLEQVLIRQGFPEGCDEVVVTDTSGHVIEGCMSNVFLLSQDGWITPSLHNCGVNGVVRRWLLQQGKVAEADEISLQQLFSARAVFMSNTLNGIAVVQSVGRHQYHQHPEVAELQQEFQELFA